MSKITKEIIFVYMMYSNLYYIGKYTYSVLN